MHTHTLIYRDGNENKQKEIQFVFIKLRSCGFFIDT